MGRRPLFSWFKRALAQEWQAKRSHCLFHGAISRRSVCKLSAQALKSLPNERGQVTATVSQSLRRTVVRLGLSLKAMDLAAVSQMSMMLPASQTSLDLSKFLARHLTGIRPLTAGWGRRSTQPAVRGGKPAYCNLPDDPISTLSYLSRKLCFSNDWPSLHCTYYPGEVNPRPRIRHVAATPIGSGCVARGHSRYCVLSRWTAHDQTTHVPRIRRRAGDPDPRSASVPVPVCVAVSWGRC
nr:hypothetical protein CFP56_29858 [Quercus suber]